MVVEQIQNSVGFAAIACGSVGRVIQRRFDVWMDGIVCRMSALTCASFVETLHADGVDYPSLARTVVVEGTAGLL